MHRAVCCQPNVYTEDTNSTELHKRSRNPWNTATRKHTG